MREQGIFPVEIHISGPKPFDQSREARVSANLSEQGENQEQGILRPENGDR